MFCPESRLLFSSAVYIQEHFRLAFFVEANHMNPNQTEQSDLGSLFVQNKLPKSISRRAEQTTKVVIGGL